MWKQLKCGLFVLSFTAVAAVACYWGVGSLLDLMGYVPGDGHFHTIRSYYGAGQHGYARWDVPQREWEFIMLPGTEFGFNSVTKNDQGEYVPGPSAKGKTGRPARLSDYGPGQLKDYAAALKQYELVEDGRVCAYCEEHPGFSTWTVWEREVLDYVLSIQSSKVAQRAN